MGQNLFIETEADTPPTEHNAERDEARTNDVPSQCCSTEISDVYGGFHIHEHVNRFGPSPTTVAATTPRVRQESCVPGQSKPSDPQSEFVAESILSVNEQPFWQGPVERADSSDSRVHENGQVVELLPLHHVNTFDHRPRLSVDAPSSVRLLEASEDVPLLTGQQQPSLLESQLPSVKPLLPWFPVVKPDSWTFRNIWSSRKVVLMKRCVGAVVVFLVNAIGTIVFKT